MSTGFIKTIRSYLEHERLGQQMRYLLVGGLCTVLDLSLLYAFVHFLSIWYLYSATLSFVIVIGSGYFAYKHFVFRNSEKNHKKQFTLFLIVAGVGLLINTGFMFVFVSWLNIWYMLASVMTKFIVLIWNFVANQRITFKK
jgi:putative flippase GtrA